MFDSGDQVFTVFMGQPAGFGGASSFPSVSLISPSLEAQLPGELQFCSTKFLERNSTDFISFPGDKRPSKKSNFRKKRLLLAQSKDIVCYGRKSRWWESEEAGHMTSTVRKWRATKAAAQLPFSACAVQRPS